MRTTFFRRLFYVVVICGLLVSILACGKKTDVFTEQPIKFTLFSNPEDIKNIFDIREISSGIYSLNVGADSLPFCLNIDSIGIIKSKNELCVLMYNPSIYNNTGVVLIRSKDKQIKQYIVNGNIKNGSTFSFADDFILRIDVSENIFAFGNPEIIQEYWIILNANFDIPMKVVTIVKNASVLQDTMKLNVSTDVFYNENNFSITVDGTINNTSFTDTIKVLPKLQIPIGISSIKWNDIFVFNVKENVENQ